MKVLTVVGARPQFIKAAVLRKLFSERGITEILVHTGQHYDHDMSKIFFDEMGMAPPEHQLTLSGRSHGRMTADIISGCENILVDENPNFCLVYGDTDSTLGAAIAASKLCIPVVHVEAGLRSCNREMPEEINRILTDHVSDLLFCSTQTAVKQLACEGITEGVYHVGDIMFDAVKMFGKSNKKYSGKPLGSDKEIAVLTIHRKASLQSPDRLMALLDYVRDVARTFEIIFPVHPGTLKLIKRHNVDVSFASVIDPLSYLSMQHLLSSSSLVLTDSGGLQKEAYFHGVRCITLREETEWIETIERGWNKLWTQESYMCDPQPIPDYGDGTTGEQVIQAMCDGLSLND